MTVETVPTVPTYGLRRRKMMSAVPPRTYYTRHTYLHISEGDPFQVEEGVLVGVLLEYAPEEGGAGREDDLVRLDLAALAGQGHVEKVPIVAQIFEGVADVPLKVVPFQTKLLLF